MFYCFRSLSFVVTNSKATVHQSRSFSFSKCILKEIMNLWNRREKDLQEKLDEDTSDTGPLDPDSGSFFWCLRNRIR